MNVLTLWFLAYHLAMLYGRQGNGADHLRAQHIANIFADLNRFLIRMEWVS